MRRTRRQWGRAFNPATGWDFAIARFDSAGLCRGDTADFARALYLGRCGSH